MDSYEIFKTLYSSDYISSRLSLLQSVSLRNLLQKILTVNQQERTDLSLHQIYQELETIWKEGEGGKEEEGKEMAIYNSFLGIEWQDGGGKKAMLPKNKTYTGKNKKEKNSYFF